MISEDIISKYKEDGVVILKNVIDDKWIETLRRGVEKNFKNPSKYKCVYETDKNNNELFYDDYCNWNKIEEYKNYGEYMEYGADR